MRLLTNVLIILVLGCLTFLTFVQEDDVRTLKNRTWQNAGGLYITHNRLLTVEGGLSVGCDLGGLRSTAVVLKVKSLVGGWEKAANGTGVFVSENMLLTAKHVVKNRVSDTSITVTTYSGKQFNSLEVYEDVDDDLALIVIDGTYGPHLQLDPRPMSLGDGLVCIGSPFTEFQKKLLVTHARVVCERWGVGDIVYEGFCWHGNSGGPVIKNNRLVAIVRARHKGGASLGFATRISRLDPDLLSKVR